MTPDEVRDSLLSHQMMMQDILGQQQQLLIFVQKVHESWNEINTEFELIRLRLATLEANDGP